MNRKDPAALHEECCAITRALTQIGDWWSLMIVREAMLGTRRFSDFQQALGIARNILCNRLNRLVDAGVLNRVETDDTGRRPEYRLTEKGRDLFVALTALRQWGDKWILTDRPPLALRDRRSGRPVRPVQVLDADGEPLGLHQVMIDEKEEAPDAGRQTPDAFR